MLTKSESITIAAIEQALPPLAEAREIIGAFHAMIRKKAAASLDPLLERAQAQFVPGIVCAHGVTKLSQMVNVSARVCRTSLKRTPPRKSLINYLPPSFGMVKRSSGSREES